MAITVIVELQANRTSGLCSRVCSSVAATLGQGKPGFLGSTRYEVLDNPDILVEIADWASAEVRGRRRCSEAMASGAWGPLRGAVSRAIPGDSYLPVDRLPHPQLHRRPPPIEQHIGRGPAGGHTELAQLREVA